MPMLSYLCISSVDPALLEYLNSGPKLHIKNSILDSIQHLVFGAYICLPNTIPEVRRIIEGEKVDRMRDVSSRHFLIKFSPVVKQMFDTNNLCAEKMFITFPKKSIPPREAKTKTCASCGF